MSEANGMHQADGSPAPRVIHLPSPRWLFSPRRGLPLAVVALIGVASVPVDPPFESAQGAQPASTTQVRIAPPADSLRWYDEAEQRDRGWDRIRQVFAVPLPTVADAPAAPPVGPVAPAGSFAGSFAVPAALWRAYTAAAAAMPSSCHLDPRLLAAIGQVESGSLAGRSLDKQHRAVPAVYGPVLDGGPYASIRDTDAGRWDRDRTWDRAVGPMQFIPSTWSRHGRDADGDGVADPQDIEDAALSAAGYLCAGGRDLAQPDGLRSAILSYNHSNSYLSAVLSLLPGVMPGGADLLFARGSDTTVAAATAAPAGTEAPTPTTGTPSTNPTTPGSSTTTSPSSSSTTTSTTTPSSTTPSSTTSPTTSTTTSSDPSSTTSTTTSGTTSPATSSTTTTSSPTTTTTPSTTTTTTPATTSTTTTTPSATTTPADCDSPTATGTATGTPTTGGTATSTTTASPTASPTEGEPTPTGTCSQSATATASPSTTPSAPPSTSSATATEAALLDGRSAPTAD